MPCKLLKKGLIGAALGAGALALLFGTAAPSYVKTTYYRVRHNVKDAVPIPFEIERARQQVNDLVPAIRDQIENLARAEEDVKDLRAELVTLTENQAKERKAIVALRTSLATGDLRLAGNSVTYTADEVMTDLRRRKNHFDEVKRIISEKEGLLKAKEKSVIAARQMLSSIQTQQRELLNKIAVVEARHKSIEAARSKNHFHFDDSPLSEAKKTIADLERRLNVMARTAELEGQFADQDVPVVVEPTGDVLKEIDEEFGTSGEPVTAEAGDKTF